MTHFESDNGETMSELTQPGFTTGATGTSELSSTHSTSTTPNGDQPSAKDKATESAQAGKQAATDVAQTAAENAKNVAAETKTQARNVAAEAKDQLREQTSAQHKNAVSNLHSLADELSSMASNGDQSGVATDLVGKAGDRARSAASWLEHREPAQLVDELRSFARQRPAVFLVGALAAGIVAGRLTRGVAAVHSSDDADSTPPALAPSPAVAPSPVAPQPTGYDVDTQQLPVGGAAYPTEGTAAYPPPLPSERIDGPSGDRW